MSAKVSPTPTRRTQVSLWIGTSVAAARENVLLPWFHDGRTRFLATSKADRGSRSISEPRLRAEIIPPRKERLAFGRSLLTPSQLRELLAAGSESRLPLREHLRLLLAIAAEECMELPDDPERREKRMQEPDYLAAKSVARAPDHLLRAIDQLGAAGWDFSAVDLPALREIEARFQKLVARCGFELIHIADGRAAIKARKADPLFANLLVIGFNAAHWPLWPLLQAAAVSAREATVLLDDPPDETRDLDETWVGSWEEFLAKRSGCRRWLGKPARACSVKRKCAASRMSRPILVRGRD